MPGIDTLMRFYNAVRIAGWVFWWMAVEGKPDSSYRIFGISPLSGIETAVVLIGRGREAWRISHLAIEAMKPDSTNRRIGQ